MSSSARKQNSRGRGGGRGSRGGRRGGNRGAKAETRQSETDALRDEDVLIAFAPFLRSDNAEALEIHAQFQSTSDQRAFLSAARQFLKRQQEGPTEAVVVEEAVSQSISSPDRPPRQTTPTVPPIVPSDTTPVAPDLTEAMDGLTVKEDPIIPLQQSPPRRVAPFSPPGILSPPAGNGNWVPTPLGLSSPPPQITESVPDTPTTTELATELKTPIRHQPKRLWTCIEQQPGRMLGNNVPYGQVVVLRPRQELTARWMLPLKYLRERAQGREMTLREAVQDLAVGLFRRGCTENGSTVSIISKEILASPSENRNDYPFELDRRTEALVGTVPFYSPRTPGNVVLRLYWQNEPLYTLATGPTVSVQVSQGDVEPTLRFILSNFKAKKGSATSLSSLHSFTTVLEGLDLNPNSRQGFDGAGKATWGCICESRKVLAVCAREYLKSKEKLKKLEGEVEELKAQQEEEENQAAEAAELTESDEHKMLITVEKVKDKTGALMGGRASNERKWRDAQLAYSNILKALVTNQSCQLLLNRDLLNKVRLELELWCPLCQSFAPCPFNSDEAALTVNMDELPHPLNGGHFQQCVDSRTKMQLDTLGFVPNTSALHQILLPKQTNRNKQGQPGSMNPIAVDTFNRLSGAMAQLYQQEYLVSERIHQQRELVRAHIESFVARCDAFPPRTRVVVFGSSANGFGSPSSDLDMCLQLPPNAKLTDEDDATGAKAMAKLAELLQGGGGMKEVDTERLTARIPIVMFTCPRPMATEGENPFMECDLSMQNPLACLNTSLLLTYSQIHPVTRVLASIIKRWAKSRDINSPSNHTLSTYGYIIMLLHFLTYHRRAGSGLVTTIDHRNDKEAWVPLLPNLQWMDRSFPESPPGTPYREFSVQPKNLMVHPLDHIDYIVNTYFYRLNDQAALAQLQRLFPGQDLSISILLASFFRYYAYEFDYKRHVVSLNSTASRGVVEREVKAETDGWRVFGTGLSIEDPFETFYDVAHVVKMSNFNRIRNEFAIAYSKIANAASGQKGSWDKDPQSMTGSDLIDWICEPCVEQVEE